VNIGGNRNTEVPSPKKLESKCDIYYSSELVSHRFNDYSSLKRCLDSLTDGVDIVFAIDRKFPNFPTDSDLSNHYLRNQYHMQGRFEYQTWLENYERSLSQ
jgi:hypothetical protein